MESIFGHAMATGRFALASGEALGANQAESVAAKVEGPSSTHVMSILLYMSLMMLVISGGLKINDLFHRKS